MRKEKRSGITFLALHGSLKQTNKGVNGTIRPIYEDYARIGGLKLPQFPVAKYEVKAELSKTKKEEESEGKDDLEEDPEEDLKGDPDKANKALEPNSD
ncbi:hypothetical protein PVK06_008819 [Gossypium arboreum]|uniref:Uncharacterized protein n=1 Tax=Gossypium arboreum TaxID=29729 RepID=A0ABR0QLU7_GOSAR|nr:hypothetical protein PVK06_008819 [Gossypium arboreum]